MASLASRSCKCVMPEQPTYGRVCVAMVSTDWRSHENHPLDEFRVFKFGQGVPTAQELRPVHSVSGGQRGRLDEGETMQSQSSAGLAILGMVANVVGSPRRTPACAHYWAFY